MKENDFSTALTIIIIALELTNYSYAPDIPIINYRETNYDANRINESHTNYNGHRTYHAEEWSSLGDPVEHRIFLKDEEGTYISTWNDIPLLTGRDRVFRVVTVVPHRTSAIMAIGTQKDLNPIIQFFQDNQQRFLPNSFSQTYGYTWSLGSFPQTWQDMHKLDELTRFAGDNGPVDVLKIGGWPAKRGQVKEVKVLAAYPSNDLVKRQTAWKVIAIDADHPSADAFNDVDDVRQHYPWLLEEVERWLRTYRVQIGLSQHDIPTELKPFVPLNAAMAAEVVLRKHENWKELQRRTTTAPYCSRLSRFNTTLDNALTVSKETVNLFILSDNSMYNGPFSILADDENNV